MVSDRMSFCHSHADDKEAMTTEILTTCVCEAGVKYGEIMDAQANLEQRRGGSRLGRIIGLQHLSKRT